MSENKKPTGDSPAATAANDAGTAVPGGADTDTDTAKKAAKTARRKPRKAAAKKAPVQDTPAAATDTQAAGAPQPELPKADAQPAKAPEKAAAKVPAKPQRKAANKPAAAKPKSAPAPTPAAAPPKPPHPLIRVAMPVRWRDLDAFNHVNNSKYLSYLEEARLQWMMTVPGMGMDDHVAPVVAAAQLAYRRPITWPAEVVIELFVERLGNTSLTVGHRIVDAKDPEVLFCDGHVVMVWIDRESGSAAPLPAPVRKACSD